MHNLCVEHQTSYVRGFIKSNRRQRKRRMKINLIFGYVTVHRQYSVRGLVLLLL